MKNLPIGCLVKVIDTGYSYPNYTIKFIELHFRKSDHNYSRENYYKDDKFKVTGKTMHENKITMLYKIISTTDPTYELLIDDRGMEIVSRNVFNKLEIL